MATPFEDTPKWFEANYYLDQKVAQMQVADPDGKWDRAAVIKNFADAGIDNPYDHYKAFGDVENLSPNALFNNTEYLAAKAAMMGSTYTVEMVAKAIHDAGLTLMEHYIQYGGKYENLSPSSDFNQDKYYDAKLQEHIAAEPDKGWTLDMVKADFAAAGITPLEHFLTYGAMEGLVDKYDFSVNGTPIPHPGNTKIVLTEGTDVVSKTATVAELKTTDRDDTISALVSSPTKSTLNADDTIDGGDGIDTLVVDMKGKFTSGFKGDGVKNVEQIQLDNANGQSFNAKGVHGANVYIVDGGVNISNVDTTATGYALKMETGNFVAQIVDSALTGKTDVVNVTLNGVGTDAADANVTVKAMTTGLVEGLNLVAQGKENFVTLTEGHETVSVYGAGDVEVTTTGDLKTFNAANAAGNVTAHLNTSTALKSILGGNADDSITVGGLTAAVNFDGGNGNDTLTFTVDPTATSKHVISGFEKIVLNNGGVMNGTNITDVTEIEVGSGSHTVTLSKFATTEMTLSADGANGSPVSYDGKGDLTLQLVDRDTDTSSSQTLAQVNANSVDTLTVTNADDNGTSGMFTVSILNAKAATEMFVNTGEGGVTIADGDLGAVTEITVTGEGNFSGAGTFKELTKVDASELKGDFHFTVNNTITAAATGDGLTIIGATNAVNAVVGSGVADKLYFEGGFEKNTIAGGGGSDVIILGEGDYTVVYGATDFTSMAAEAGTLGDTISGFDAGNTGADVFQFKTGLLVAANAATFGTGALKIVEAAATADFTALAASSADAGMIEINTNFANADDAASVASLLTGTVAQTMSVIFSISDGSDSYLWYFTGTSTTAARIEANELVLVGVVEGVGVGGFETGDFTIVS